MLVSILGVGRIRQCSLKELIVWCENKTIRQNLEHDVSWEHRA